MEDSKYNLFSQNICSAVTSSVYNGWEPKDLNNLSSSSRTIYYDSNLAFTSGNKSIVSSTNGDGSLLAIPDLYGTLNGLNSRINSVNSKIDGMQDGEISTADAHLYVNTNDNEHIISPGNGNYQDKLVATNFTTGSISLQSTSSSNAKFTVNGDDFAFTVGSNAYTLTEIFTMIEELHARTSTIKTNADRKEISLTGSQKYVLTENTIQTKQ